MTEAEWLACNDPDEMIYYLTDGGAYESTDSLRLLAVGASGT
jgi:hypothetical protein